jgi:hypothetical protein
MAKANAEARKPLGVRVTPEQHRLITEAAAKENRSVSNFVLQAALRAADKNLSLPPRYDAAETESRIREARELFRQSDLHKRDLVTELIEERRIEAGRE